METMAEKFEREHVERLRTERAVYVPQPILDKDGCDICEICHAELRQSEAVWRPTPSSVYFDTGGRTRHFWEHVECRQASDRARVASSDQVATVQHPDLVVRDLESRVGALEGRKR